jgi:PAS domain S-box-containing protein
MMKTDMSVTKVVVLTLVAVTTIVLSAFGIANYCWERSQRLNELESVLDVTATQLASSLAVPLWHFDTEQVDKIIESTMQNRAIYGVIIREPGDLKIVAAFARDDQWRIVPIKDEIRTEDLVSRTAGIQIYGKQVGTVHLFMTPRFMEKSLANFAAITIAGIITLNACLVIIPFQLLRRKVIKPLKEIETYALKVSTGGAETAHIPAGGFFGELENLRRSIVAMTRSLAAAREDQVARMAEQVLQESEETLKAFMNVMPVGVNWTDSSGTTKHVNSCFVELFGYNPDDIPTLDDWYLHAYSDPAYRDKAIANWHAAINKAQADGTPIQPVESFITCKDGTVRHVIVNTQFARNLRLAIFTDITEREAMQNRLLNAQRLESLGVLAGGIAHDFNNILTGIMGNISFARMVLATPEKSDKLLENAEKASLRAAELATQLLTFAKGGAPVKKAVSVLRLLNESLSLTLRGTNSKADIEIPDNLHDIEADEGQISQVFNNLLINSIHAMPDGGRIRVEGTNVNFGANNDLMLPPGQYVRLSFCDEGCGMPEEVRKKIFDPYFTTKSDGIGIGLASVHSIISRHGGHIDVQSRVGRGTTFTIHLPSIGAASTDLVNEKKTTVIQAHAGGSILVMDDEEIIRKLASTMLEHLGFEVKTCSNGEEAVRMYRTAKDACHPFTFVIMDLTIPGGMGGRESAEIILGYDPAARLIASSGYSNDPILAAYNSYGFCGAVAKPYKMEELMRVLQHALEPEVS